jgi:hypothetical protein
MAVACCGLSYQIPNGHGGKCALCDYDRCLDALSFRHEGEKEFGIGAKGYTRSWEKVKAELDECILVCSNCHAEMHAGLTKI